MEKKRRGKVKNVNGAAREIPVETSTPAHALTAPSVGWPMVATNAPSVGAPTTLFTRRGGHNRGSIGGGGGGDVGISILSQAVELPVAATAAAAPAAL